MEAKDLFTIGEIAIRCNVPRHAVVYCLESRNIEPTCRVGQAKAYDLATVQRIKSELQRIKEARDRK